MSVVSDVSLFANGSETRAGSAMITGEAVAYSCGASIFIYLYGLIVDLINVIVSGLLAARRMAPNHSEGVWLFEGSWLTSALGDRTQPPGAEFKEMQGNYPQRCLL